MPVDRRYSVLLERAWTKEGIVIRLGKRLERYPREAIVSIDVGIDFTFFWPFRRNWAIVTVDKSATP